MIQTSKPHWGGTRNGKSAIPSAFALRQPWPSVGRDSRRDGEKIVQNVRDLKRSRWNRRRRRLQRRNA